MPNPQVIISGLSVLIPVFAVSVIPVAIALHMTEGKFSCKLLGHDYFNDQCTACGRSA